MINRNVFYIVGGISSVVISLAVILLVAKNVVGFDIGGASTRDCVPYNVFIQKSQKNHSADIIWNTKAECIGFVQYGRDRSNLDMVSIDLVNKSKSKVHSVSLDQLLGSEVYYFLINSQGQPYGNNGVPLEFVLENL